VRVAATQDARITDINTYRDPNCNSHCDGNVYTNIDAETYAHTEDCPDAEAASYAATAAIMPELVMSD
jgi:hypothetical protein